MTDQSEAKRLRSSEPDLQIILGSDDDVVTKWCHSPTLASKSKYIDAMLAAPMQESENRTITFPDISFEIWGKMIKFLDDPVAVREMTAEDALAVAVFYDKYEFDQGRRLCEYVMLDYFGSLAEMEKNHTLDLELVIDLTIKAHQANLNTAFNKGIGYLWSKMKSRGKDSTYGRTMFTEEHLNRILPVLKYFHRSQREALQIGSNTRRMDRLDQPGFAREFVSDSHKHAVGNLLEQCMSHIVVSGTSCNADGEFFLVPTSTCWVYESEDSEYPEESRHELWGGQRVIFRLEYIIDASFEGWAIVRYREGTRFDEFGDQQGEENVVPDKCWIAPYSKGKRFPPTEGWTSADPLARGEPTIKYVLHECFPY